MFTMETDLENNLIEISQMKTSFENIAETVQCMQAKAECRAEVDEKLTALKITNSMTFKRDINRLDAILKDIDQEIHDLISGFKTTMQKTLHSFETNIYKLRRLRAQLMVELEKFRQQESKKIRLSNRNDLGPEGKDHSTSFMNYEAWKSTNHNLPQKRKVDQPFYIPALNELGLKRRLNNLDDEERELVSSSKRKMKKLMKEFQKSIGELHTVRAKSCLERKKLDCERRKLNTALDHVRVGSKLDHFSSFDDTAWRNMHHGTDYEF